MTVHIRENFHDMLTLEVRIPLSGSMLDMENEIQDRLNEAGRVATAEALKKFDTDGSPIILSKTKLTARKEKASQHYECPYGTVPIERFLYQSNEGGYTYCPLEDRARIFTTSTPRYAQIVSGLYADLDGGKTKRHLYSTLRRETCKANIQNLAEAVATVAQVKEEKWEYDLPPLDAEVASVAFGLDGAYMLMRDDGWREAMCGTISLYDKSGNRLHTSYFAAPPEHGKQHFHTKLEREITRTKDLFPKARYVGLGDGAKDNWTFLEQHTSDLILDFWHVSEYVHKAADAYWGSAQKWKESKEDWLEHWLHRLKHDMDGAAELIAELKSRKKELKGEKATVVQKTIGYMENHLELMNYGLFVKRCLPIGSGVIEASCKTVVKSRMCVSGAGWSPTGAGVVLSLRTLHLSEPTWEVFWERIMRYGVPGAKDFGAAKNEKANKT
jgi:hypothetical protein